MAELAELADIIINNTDLAVVDSAGLISCGVGLSPDGKYLIKQTGHLDDLRDTWVRLLDQYHGMGRVRVRALGTP